MMANNRAKRKADQTWFGNLLLFVLGGSLILALVSAPTFGLAPVLGIPLALLMLSTAASAVPKTRRRLRDRRYHE